MKVPSGTTLHLMGPDTASDGVLGAMEADNTLVGLVTHTCPYCKAIRHSAGRVRHGYDKVVLAHAGTHAEAFCSKAGCDPARLPVPAVWNGAKLSLGFDDSKTLDQYR